MRDDRRRWDAPRGADAAFAAENVTVSTVHPERQTIVSGPDVLDRIELPVVEWPQVARESRYALSLRRDRALVVNGPDLPEGWDAAAGRAVTDASDAYRVLAVSGPGAFDLLSRGLELDLKTPSRSVSRLAFGIEALLYRFGDDESFRIHVNASQAETLWKHLTTIPAHPAW